MRVPARRERPSRSRLWILLIAIGIGAGSAAALFLRSTPREASSAATTATAAPTPIASLSPVNDSAAPPAATQAGQTSAAQELTRLAPELTLASSEMLVREVSYASGVRLAETGLVLATRGFETMERGELEDLQRLFEEVYGTLSRPDHEWMAEYMRSVRDGTLDAEASARGRGLLTQGVERLPSARRDRLQALIEKAIRAGIESRRTSVARMQQAALTAPPLPTPAPDPTASSATPTSSAESNEAPGAGPQARGEAYWRSRMQGMRARVASLKAQIARLEQTANAEAYGPTLQPRCHAPERINSESQQAFLDCAKALQNYPAQQSAAQAARLFELEQLREQLKLSERAIVDIEDEARRAGALPGWLRD